MPKSRLSLFSRYLVAAVCVLVAVLLPATAFAEGRVVWNNKHPQERDDHSWHLGVKIYLHRAPGVPHIPAKFEFTPKVYYERDLIDGNKIVERAVPLRNNPPIIEDVDIGFLDPGTGKIQKRTRFTFKITRAHDFKAGEYTVKIRDSRNGRIIGSPIRLILGGKNKPIDRRTMVFSGDIGSKKGQKRREEMKHVDRNGDVTDEGSGSGDDNASSSDNASGDNASDNSGGGNDSASGGSPDNSSSSADDDNTPPSGDNGANAAPPPVKPKPGCNCRIEASHAPADPALLFAALALVGGFVARRRYR